MKYRIITQLIFYFLFLFLLINTTYPLNIKEVDFFLTLSPLLGLTTFIASHKLLVEFLPALVIVLLTIILGRVFCGWICPFGTTLDWTDKLFKPHSAIRIPQSAFRNLKYYFLVSVLLISLLGINISGWLDPLSLVTRTYTTVILPYLSFLIRLIFDSIYHLLPSLRLYSEPIYDFLKRYVIGYEQPIFTGHIFIAIIFIIIVLFGILSRRYWCQNLCPLGGLLSILSFKTFLKRQVNKSCGECDKCLDVCKMNRLDCIRCFNCVSICSTKAITFTFSPLVRSQRSEVRSQRSEVRSQKSDFKGNPLSLSSVFCLLSSVLCLLFSVIKKWVRGLFSENVTPVNLSRRGFLFTLAGSLILTGMLKLKKTNATLIRPPGALVEKEFLSMCLRCGECMKVCQTNGLQPALLDAGLEGLWTPKLVPRVGYCEYNCILCSQVCPSGAIKKITLNEKKKIVIGMAVIDKNVCLPYAKNKECLVCEEMCPTPTKAIKFKKVKVGEKTIRRPVVLKKECIGCGICEYKCPLEGKPGIEIVKDRSKRSGVRYQ